MPEARRPALPAFDLKAWEKGLVAAAVALFLAAFYLYVSSYPLKQLIFGLQDEGVMQVVGAVAELKGGLRRQASGEAEFRGVAKQTPLYDQDTLVTGPDTTAVLRLEDGSTIEMGPNAMIKLSFESGFGFGGISHAANVQVVAGKVTGESQRTKVLLKMDGTTIDTQAAGRKSVESARPAPVPVARRAAPPLPTAAPQATPPPVVPIAPIAVAPITPRPGAELAVPSGAERAELPVEFYWGVLPVGSPTRFTLWRQLGANGRRRERVAQAEIATAGEQASHKVVLRAPGLYEWEIGSGDARRPTQDGLQKSAFRVKAPFEGIRVLDPLVGGQKGADNRIRERRLQSFGITLQWQPYPATDAYRVQLKRDLKDAAFLLDRQTREPRLGFSRDKLFEGKFHYQISGVTKAGFQVYSPWKEFTYQYLAPIPMQPADKAVFSPDMVAREGHSVLITWQKTNFTDHYELELSQDAEFKKVVAKERLRDNFFVYRVPPAGRYWWRVRSSAGTVLSSPSAPREFTIQ